MSHRECEQYRNMIPRASLGDLESGLRAELDAHLAACESCGAEQAAYQGTIQQLHTVEDVPVPQHFFVPPETVRSGPWQLLRELGLGWKVATAGGVLGFVVLFAFTLGRVQFRVEDGVYAFSFGRALPELNAAAQVQPQLQALQTELRSFVEQSVRAERQRYLATLRSELNRAGQSLSLEQRRLLAVALNEFETRLNERITTTGSVLQAGTARSVDTLYDTLQTQRRQDMIWIQNRMTQAALQNDVKDRQTEAVLNTLIQVADLGMRGMN